MKSICKMSCPWFSEGTRVGEAKSLGGYGCHKYSVAMMCVASQIKGVSATQYELFVDEDRENGLMRKLIAIAIPTLGTPREWEAESIVRSSPAVLPVA